MNRLRTASAVLATLLSAAVLASADAATAAHSTHATVTAVRREGQALRGHRQRQPDLSAARLGRQDQGRGLPGRAGREGDRPGQARRRQEVEVDRQGHAERGQQVQVQGQGHHGPRAEVPGREAGRPAAPERLRPTPRRSPSTAGGPSRRCRRRSPAGSTRRRRSRSTAWPTRTRWSTFGTASAYSVDYNLNRKCTLIEAPLRRLRQLAGGQQRDARRSRSTGCRSTPARYGLTQSAVNVTDVTGAFRVTLGATTGGATAAVASPRVLCSF